MRRIGISKDEGLTGLGGLQLLQDRFGARHLESARLLDIERFDDAVGGVLQVIDAIGR